MALVDYFLKIDGIQGESQDSKHKGEIQLESFSWGETHATAPAAGGAGAGRVQVHDLHVTTPVSKASPLLMLACASGQHLKSAVLTARKAGRDQQEFLVFKFNDLIVSSYEIGAAASDQHLPVDQVAFSFGQISVDYRPQKPDGTLDASVHVGWDVRANKRI